MRRMWKGVIIGLIMFGWVGTLKAQQVGLLPTPVLQGVEVQAGATYDVGQDRYTYNYTIINPASNTGEIFLIYLDLSTPFSRQVRSGAGFTIPVGAITLTFDEVLAMRSDPAPRVPVGMEVPPAWAGTLGFDATAVFSTGGRTIGSDEVLPGDTQGGFVLISAGPVTLREMELTPDWVLLVDSEEDVTEEMAQQARDLEDSLPLKIQTLGPSWVFPGTIGHWNQLRDDLSKAIQIGWITDPALGSILESQLALAREALDARDGTLAKSRLDALIQTINQSTPSQRRPEVVDLVLLNVDQLIGKSPDTTFPFTPEASFDPQMITLPIGALYTLTVTVINTGDPTQPPVTSFPISFQFGCAVPKGGSCVEDSIHQGLVSGSGVTDGQGKVSFSFIGSKVGKDRIEAGNEGEGGVIPLGSADVVWSGGPDLVVPLFIPPFIEVEGGDSIELQDRTANLGSVAVGESITRYFLSEDAVVDPGTDFVLGERTVPALQPGEEHEGPVQTETVPANLSLGEYYLAACADAPATVVELEEQNNCSFNIIEGLKSLVIPQISIEVPNTPPICSAAVPSQSILWPPNHKLATIVIQGVVDPETDPVTIVVTGITQDEPVNEEDDGEEEEDGNDDGEDEDEDEDGDLSPDGFGIGDSQAQVRKERSGTGNGRVYAIAFTGDDGNGGTCNGFVSVGVPHDQKPGNGPIDDGQIYNSTLP